MQNQRTTLPLYSSVVGLLIVNVPVENDLNSRGYVKTRDNEEIELNTQFRAGAFTNVRSF